MNHGSPSAPKPAQMTPFTAALIAGSLLSALAIAPVALGATGGARRGGGLDGPEPVQLPEPVEMPAAKPTPPAKPAAKPEPKPEAKPEPKAETKPQAKPEPKPAASSSAGGGGPAMPEDVDPVNAPAAIEQRWYPVSELRLTYASRDRELPPLETFFAVPVELVRTDRGLVAPGVARALGIPGEPTRVTIAQINASGGGALEWSAIEAIARTLVQELRSRGLAVLFVAPASDQIDQSRKDLRGSDTVLDLLLYTGRIEEVRSVAVTATGEQVVDRDAKLDRRVREGSPLQVGDLAREDILEQYLGRLNRHPGRRVTASLARADTASPNRVSLDFQIAEAKPWLIYAQASNTGTESTNRWRQTFGAIHNQLTGNDDILSLNYTTATFSKFHALQGSYEFPIVADRLRLKTFASYTSYRASDVGQLAQSFRGENWGGGAELAWNFTQFGGFFLDAIGGVRVEGARVNNELLAQVGSVTFVTPYAGLRLERATPAMTTFAQVTLEGQVSSPERQQLINLGRANPDREFVIAKFQVDQSMYIEPLLGEKVAPKTLAHEIGLAFRGQISDYRLPPTFQQTAGGFYSVRGYKESVVAGDSVYIASAEYRFHLPRALPIFDPAAMGEEYKGGPRTQSLFGSPFRAQPDQDYGITDWDLVFRGFVDVGRTVNAKKLNFEKDQTLVGTGIGLEFQLRRNLIIRADWGFAATGLTDFLGNTIVRSGSSRLHFIATLSY